MRFCHQSSSYLKSNSIYFSGRIKNAINQLNDVKKENYYVISENYIYGVIMNLEELLSYLDEEYMSVVAITYSSSLIKEENEGDSFNHILK